MSYDLILRGGRVIDPSQRLDAVTDVAFSGGKVARIGPGLKGDANTDVRDLAGAIVTETIFSWPGVGRLTIQAISNRDYYLVQGCILAIGLTYVAVNFLTDVLYSVANPRIRQ